MKLQEIMKGPRLKVKRAESHINNVLRDSSPFSKDLYSIYLGPAGTNGLPAKPYNFYLVYHPKQHITDYFSPMIGDAVNNLRESLDYWMNAAIAAIGTPKKVHFPFAEKWQDLKGSPHYPAVHKAFPDAAEFIFKDVKPCRNTNLHLWAATSLCNFNKHNDFVPTVAVTEINDINIRADTNLWTNCFARGDANRTFAFFASRERPKIDSHFRTTLEIKFPKGAIFENQPVVPTLLQMSQVVSKTLDALEKFLAPFVK